MSRPVSHSHDHPEFSISQPEQRISHLEQRISQPESSVSHPERSEGSAVTLGRSSTQNEEDPAERAAGPTAGGRCA